ncbi:MAG: hypothetical protein VW270_24625, partial [Candidatus Poseidoniales archaeon]
MLHIIPLQDSIVAEHIGHIIDVRMMSLTLIVAEHFGQTICLDNSGSGITGCGITAMSGGGMS